MGQPWPASGSGALNTTILGSAGVSSFEGGRHCPYHRPQVMKRCLFHQGGQECKSRKSRDTWSNRQIWPRSTKLSRAKANKFCQENPLVIANTLFQQHKRKLYTWTSPDGQYQNQIDYILCSQRCRSYIQSGKTRPGADLAQIMNSLLQNSDLN